MKRLNNLLRRYWWIALILLSGISSELPRNIKPLLSVFVIAVIIVSNKMKEQEEMEDLRIAPIEGNPAYHEAKVRQCRANLDKYTYKNALVVSVIVGIFMPLLNISQFIFSLDIGYLGLPIMMLAIALVISFCYVDIVRTKNKRELEYHEQKLIKMSGE